MSGFDKIKNIFEKIINFYTEPYSDLKFNISVKNNPKPKKIKNKNKRNAINGETTLETFINYYKKNTLKVFIQIIISIGILFGVGIGLFVILKVFIFDQIWAILLISIVIVYSIIKPGMYYLFERKREVTNGIFLMIEDYIGNATHVSFKNFVENLDDSRYPRIFIDEFLNPMKKTMQTTYSEEALKEQLNIPRNSYYEVEKYKDFIIKAIASNDPSIRKALKVAIETSNESKKAYLDKMKATSFIVYIAIGFVMLFPAIFELIFLTTLSGVSLAGLSSKDVIPSALTFNLWFIFAVISSAGLIIGTKYYAGEEGQSVNYGQYTLIVLTILVMILYGVILTI